jgi:hypothetical protein
MASTVPGLSAGVTLILTSWLVARLFAEARRAPSVDADGTLILRYGTGIRVVGIVSGLVVPLGLLVLAWVSPPDDRGEVVAVASLLTFFLVGGGWMLLESRRAQIVVTAAGLTETTLWGQVRELPWAEVQAVRFSPGMGYITLTGDTVSGDRRRVRVSVLMVGVPALWAAMARHLTPERYADAEAKYTAYAQRQGARAA